MFMNTYVYIQPYHKRTCICVPQCARARDTPIHNVRKQPLHIETQNCACMRIRIYIVRVMLDRVITRAHARCHRRRSPRTGFSSAGSPWAPPRAAPTPARACWRRAAPRRREATRRPWPCPCAWRSASCRLRARRRPSRSRVPKRARSRMPSASAAPRWPRR